MRERRTPEERGKLREHIEPVPITTVLKRAVKRIANWIVYGVIGLTVVLLSVLVSNWIWGEPWIIWNVYAISTWVWFVIIPVILAIWRILIWVVKKIKRHKELKKDPNSWEYTDSWKNI